jgi:RNA polymerase sigma factor (sigma-70 family)
VNPHKQTYGDDGEFEDFGKLMLPRIIALAFSVTRDRCDAEDVAIETLARAFLKWPKLRGDEWREGWALRVAANQSIDILRARQREQKSIQWTEDPGYASDPAEFPSALRGLPRRQQQVVVLRFYGDLSYADIASRLRISEGSVKRHLHRGLAALRKDFGSEDGSGGSHVHYAL